jgi:hypothetical protein
MPQKPPRKALTFLLAACALVAAGVCLGLLYADWRARQLAELTSDALHAGTSVLPAGQPDR